MLTKTIGKIEVEVEIEEAVKNTPLTLKDGIYMATFCTLNDRIVLVSKGKIIAQLDTASPNRQLNVQDGTDNLQLYRNYKPVKKFDLKVTL